MALVLPAEKEKWLILASTQGGETLVMFEDDGVRVSVPGDEGGSDLSQGEIEKLILDKFSVKVEMRGFGCWEAGEAEFESVGFFSYA